METEKKDSNLTFGVVIPNFNDAKFFPIAFKSVFEQNVPADEIIVVDDCSTDESADVIKQNIDGVKNASLVMLKQRVGTMSALNVGLNRITTDYVCFLSSNDFWNPGLINTVKKDLVFQCAGIWSSRMFFLQDTRKAIYPSVIPSFHTKYLSPDDCVRLAYRAGPWFCGVSMFFNTKAIKSIGGFQPSCGGLADMYAALYISANFGAIFNPLPTGVMRIHGNSFLEKTLTGATLGVALEAGEEIGKSIAPKLFTQEFCQRTRRRIEYASLKRVSEYLNRSVSLSPREKIICFLLKRLTKNSLFRSSILFALVRPFDCWQTLKRRIIPFLVMKFLRV